MINAQKGLFSKMEKATRSAFDKVGSVTGDPIDPDLGLYMKLKSDDFPRLIEQYGDEPIFEYIRKMEFAKLKSTGG